MTRDCRYCCCRCLQLITAILGACSFASPLMACSVTDGVSSPTTPTRTQASRGRRSLRPCLPPSHIRKFLAPRSGLIRNHQHFSSPCSPTQGRLPLPTVSLFPFALLERPPLLPAPPLHHAMPRTHTHRPHQGLGVAQGQIMEREQPRMDSEACSWLMAAWNTRLGGGFLSVGSATCSMTDCAPTVAFSGRWIDGGLDDRQTVLGRWLSRASGSDRWRASAAYRWAVSRV